MPIAIPGDPGLLYSRTHFLFLFSASRPSAFSLLLTLYFLAQNPGKEQNRGSKELIPTRAQEEDVEVGGAFLFERSFPKINTHTM